MYLWCGQASIEGKLCPGKRMMLNESEGSFRTHNLLYNNQQRRISSQEGKEQEEYRAFMLC